MVVPSRRQQHQQSHSTSTSASMAYSRNSAMTSSRQYDSSRYYESSRYESSRYDSYVSESDYESPSHSQSSSSRDTWERDTWDDLPPTVLDTASASASESSESVATYDSSLSETEEEETPATSDDDDDCIPPAVMPPLRCAPMTESSIRPSDPETFSRLFPSMDRLSIRHDDRTTDGSMNLRVDTIVADPASHRRRPVTIQLFHLRMHDLARREFSLQRYCRDSGREVCNSKGANPRADPSSSSSSSLKAVTSALRTVKTSFRRSSNSGEKAAAAVGLSTSPPGDRRRPSFASNRSRGCTSVFSISGDESSSDEVKPPSARPIPANTIKLEFSNYARVDMIRRSSGSKQGYEFEWWGHTYSWRRVVDKSLGKVSFHLIRDGAGEPVAMIVPEGRSPNQIRADNDAGAWVPPCYMWICDNAVIEAMTDVADVIVSTGLMALVDDSIKQRWPAVKKPTKKPVLLPSVPSIPIPIRPHFLHTSRDASAAPVTAAPVTADRPRGFVHGLWHRAHTHTFSPLRFGHAVVAY